MPYLSAAHVTQDDRDPAVLAAASVKEREDSRFASSRILQGSAHLDVNPNTYTYFDDTLDRGLWTSLVVSKSRCSAALCQKSTLCPSSDWPYHVKGVITLAHQQGTVVARILACRTGSIERNTTDTAGLVFRLIPTPGRNRVPLLDSDLHV